MGRVNAGSIAALASIYSRGLHHGHHGSRQDGGAYVGNNIIVNGSEQEGEAAGEASDDHDIHRFAVDNDDGRILLEPENR